MKKRQPNRTYRGRLLKAVCLLGIIMIFGSSVYVWYLSTQVEKRFSGRRWSIPSKVFSDSTILYPGQHINRDLFYRLLNRLDYRQVVSKPKHKGELRSSPSSVDLFLHDLKTPARQREGFPVRISFQKNQITSIVNIESGESIPILEVEPEEVMLFFGPERERRRLISIKQVPTHVIYAILSAEDSRFYQHRGVDPRGMLRAAYKNLRHFRIDQGGSTITQQLAKNYFLTPERTLSRKFKELCLALTMEVVYEKEEILEIYLNEIYLGQKGSEAINGIEEASYFYFGKPVRELSLNEAATIAGLIRAPNYYSPYVNKDRCKNRRNTVLNAMHRVGWLPEKELQVALAKPIRVVGFKTYGSGRKAPYFMDYLSQQLASLYSPDALTSLGLSIYTTLDTQVQIAAERALTEGLTRLEQSNPSLKRSEPEKRLQGAIVVMQPKTGYVLAMVGGRDYNTSQFNRITQAKRQPGSAFKPLVYVSALNTFTPASLLSNEPKTYTVDGKAWQPENYASTSEKHLSVRNALAKSVNLPTVDLAMQVGLDHIVATAKAFGFSTPIMPYPSIALGAFEVIPMELARAYCAFAADGLLPYPLTLREVLDENENTLERKHMTIKRVTSPAKAFLMSSMLRSVVTEGTAHCLRGMGVPYPVAGKTGTTNDYRDGWFVGYTPDILALVWVGFDNGDPTDATGSSAALPIWADLINAIPQYVSGEWLKMPPGVAKRLVCQASGDLAVKGKCPRVIEEIFLVDNIPSRDCALHGYRSPVEKIFKGMHDLLKKF